jgi:hypothetical protein
VHQLTTLSIAFSLKINIFILKFLSKETIHSSERNEVDHLIYRFGSHLQLSSPLRSRKLGEEW